MSLCVARLLNAPAVLAAAAALSGIAAGAAQTRAAPPQFRAGVTLVEVDVSVSDATGRPVTDLRQEEFVVLEGGRERRIVSFARVEAPGPGPHPWAPRDVTSNAGADQGRIVFLVLDDANTSKAGGERVRQAARDLVARLGPNDAVGMMFVSLGAQGAFEFTTDHAAVAQGIDAYEGQRVTRRSFGPDLLADARPSAGAGEPLDLAAAPVFLANDLKLEFDRARPYALVRNVSEYLAVVPHRRKALVYVGQGLAALGPRQPDEGDSIGRLRLDLERSITAARRANVAVYLLDPSAPLREGAEGLFEGHEEDETSMRRAAGLAGLASMTGGFGARDVVSRQIDRIVADAGTYYLLAYEAAPGPERSTWERLRAPTNPWAGFRSIEVRTTRPKVTIRARRGYWPGGPEATVRSRVADGAKAPGIDDAVRAVLPDARLALTTSAVALPGQTRGATVVLTTEVRDPSLVETPAGGLHESLEMTIVAAGPGRVVASDRMAAKMSLAPDRMSALGEGAYLVCATLALPPGRYQVRVGVRSAAAGKSGSVYHDLVVPDFGGSRPMLSGVALGLTRASGPPVVARARVLEGLVPFVPTPVREFRTGDSVVAHVRVHVPPSARPSSAGVTLRAEVGEGPSDTPEWQSSVRVSFDRPGEVPISIPLPLATISAGYHELRLSLVRGNERLDERRLSFDVVR